MEKIQNSDLILQMEVAAVEEYHQVIMEILARAVLAVLVEVDLKHVDQMEFRVKEIKGVPLQV